MHGYEIEFVFGVPLYNTSVGYTNSQFIFMDDEILAEFRGADSQQEDGQYREMGAYFSQSMPANLYRSNFGLHSPPMGDYFFP